MIRLPLAGFGSLLLARHYGVFSMGLLLVIAISTVLLATLTVLPLLLSNPRAASVCRKHGGQAESLL